MTDEQRRLLLLIARAVAEIEEDKAEQRQTTSHLAKEIRDLVEVISANQ